VRLFDSPVGIYRNGYFLEKFTIKFTIDADHRTGQSFFQPPVAEAISYSLLYISPESGVMGITPQS
jgi:hypothetical protein